MSRALLLQRPVLLFPQRRRLCRWAARVISRIDRRHELTLMPIEHGEAGALFTPVSEKRRASSWWIVLRDGTPVRGDRSGILLLFVALWIVRPVGRVPRRLRLSSFLDTLDEALADYRCARGARRAGSGGVRGAVGPSTA